MSPGLPRAQIAHSLPGRTRIRVPGRKHDREYFENGADKLAELDGTGSVVANPGTASFLVLHRTSLEALGDFARAKGLFDLKLHDETNAAGPRSLPHAFADSFDLADLALRIRTGGRVDLVSIIFGALVAAAGFQMYRGKTLPAGVSLLHYAFHLIPRPPGQPIGAARFIDDV